MDKQQEYQNHASSIGKIYTILGVHLGENEKKWLDDIFRVTANIDELIDHGDTHAGGIVLNIIASGKGAIDSHGFDYTGDILELRNHLLSLDKGEERLTLFIRTLKILFRQTKKISTVENISEYFKSSILEGRAFGRMVALGIGNMEYQNIIRQAGGMENLTDDILDIEKDFSSGERKMIPSINYYITGLRFTVSEIINMQNKFGLVRSGKAIKASMHAMWKKYIHEQLFH